MSRIDDETRQRVGNALDYARIHGSDTVDLLDRIGMLRYHDRNREDQALFLEQLIDDVRRMPIDVLSPGGNHSCVTREDHRQALIRFLDQVKKGLSHGSAKH